MSTRDREYVPSQDTITKGILLHEAKLTYTPIPLSVPSIMCPLFEDHTLLTAWKKVVPESAGVRPEVM